MDVHEKRALYLLRSDRKNSLRRDYYTSPQIEALGIQYPTTTAMELTYATHNFYGNSFRHTTVTEAIVIGNTLPVTLGFRRTTLMDVFLSMRMSAAFNSIITSPVL